MLQALADQVWMEADSSKETSVLLVHNNSKRKHYIVLKLGHSNRRVQLIRIDPKSGNLRSGQTTGRDIFASESSALEYVNREGQHEVVASGKAVLGYVVVGPWALLLLVERTRVSVTLPGGHEIKTVTASKWQRIPLQTDVDFAEGNVRGELERGVDKIVGFPIDGAHIYCETLDITRPFPSDRPVCQPSWEFVWNRWLTTSFRSLGLDSVCPPLLQGLAEARALEDFDGNRFSYALIARRGRLHVGPRYHARGLNDQAEPGNEIECEQIVWKHNAPNKPVAWSRYVWRRGSVPLWWSVSLKNVGIEAEIVIKPQNTFRGSYRYVRRLQKRYMPNPHLDPDPPEPQDDRPRQDLSLTVPIMFVSLLRKGTPDKDRSEAKLSSAFNFVVMQLCKEYGLPLDFVGLDWHEMHRELGGERIVEAFWCAVRSLLPRHGFALGTLSKVGQDHTDPLVEDVELGPVNGGVLASPPLVAEPRLERCVSQAGRGWQARWFRQQCGVMRYNCADSLDRTNVTSFFGAVQVFIEQCRELDIAIAATSPGAASIARTMARKQMQAAAAAAVSAPSASAGGGSNGSGSSRPRSGADSNKSAMGTLESLGKQLNRNINAFMLDFKSPKSSPHEGSSGAPGSTGSSPHGDPRSSSAPVLMAQRPVLGQLLEPSGGRAAAGAMQATPASAGAAQAVPLPAGWEAKYDKDTRRIFYVDHNTKTTTWERPMLSIAAPSSAPQPPAVVVLTSGTVGPQSSIFDSITAPFTAAAGAPNLERKSVGRERERDEGEQDRLEPLTPWGMLDVSVKRFGRRVSTEALSAMAELFLLNGDLCAYLYTGSAAMHSEKILIFEPESSRLRKASVTAYGNPLIAIKRRYNNVIMDSDKLMQTEMFLGLKATTYFPTARMPYKDDAVLPLDYPESDDESDPIGRIPWPLPDKAPRVTAGLLSLDLADSAMMAGGERPMVSSPRSRPTSSRGTPGQDHLSAAAMQKSQSEGAIGSPNSMATATLAAPLVELGELFVLDTPNTLPLGIGSAPATAPRPVEQGPEGVCRSNNGSPARSLTTPAVPLAIGRQADHLGAAHVQQGSSPLSDPLGLL